MIRDTENLICKKILEKMNVKKNYLEVVSTMASDMFRAEATQTTSSFVWICYEKKM